MIEKNIENTIKDLAGPWKKLQGKVLVEELRNTSFSALEISRALNISPQKVIKDVPLETNINGQIFKINTFSQNNLPILKMIRKSVIEPPIKGVRNGSHRFDEKIFAHKEKQEKIKRVTFKLFSRDILEEERLKQIKRNEINLKKGERIIRKTMPSWRNTQVIENDHFTPEDIILLNGKLENAKTIKIKATLDETMGLSTSKKEEHSTITEILHSASQKQPSEKLISHIMSKVEKNEEISFGLMCLPCLNPNPFITDHPSITINTATVIFLERLNCLGGKIQENLKTKVTFKIARELEHMAKIFPLTNENISNGISDINEVIRKRELNHIEICDFPSSNDLKPTSPKDINKFVHAFENSQFSESIDTIVMMKWLGVINDADASSAIKKHGVKLNDQEGLIKLFTESARAQAAKWATIREFPWQNFGKMKDTITISIRPGSNNFTIVPVCIKGSEKLPMLPQHSSVGISQDKSLITMKRVEFLLHPSVWLEILTEFGSIFVHRSLI